jgi:predicted dienelactone hydrolase
VTMVVPPLGRADPAEESNLTKRLRGDKGGCRCEAVHKWAGELRRMLSRRPRLISAMQTLRGGRLVHQKSLARLVMWTTVLGAALATADGAPAGPVIEPKVVNLAGLDVAVWQPTGSPGQYPLVLFSHGAGGCKTQSTYLMNALAQDGMLVAAPDHSDKSTNCPARLPERSDLPADLLDDGKWGPSFHDDRRDDLRGLLAALKADPAYSGLIDTTRVALVGHSLGGYTVLALAGAWPSWKMDGIAAVVALAPFSQPFMRGGKPSEIEVPVLFQVGSEDGLTPEEVTRPIFAASGAPACIISYPGADHFDWTDQQPAFHDVTAAVVAAFLDEIFAGGTATEAVLAAPGAEEKPECK